MGLHAVEANLHCSCWFKGLAGGLPVSERLLMPEFVCIRCRWQASRVPTWHT